MPDIRIDWDHSALKLFCEHGPPQGALMQMAARAVVAMKAAAPVSPVQPAYAYPVQPGSSAGTTYQGRGLALPKGPAVARYRAAGDLPLRPSGYLRSSVKAMRLPDGSIVVGPTAPYAKYVIEGTRPHEIRSHGPWPLRNRATGQVFGPRVHHPGTAANNFVLKAAFGLRGARFHI
jgi:hypothetical protein